MDNISKLKINGKEYGICGVREEAIVESVEKLESDVSTLEQMADGTLYATDENFPACDGNSGFLYPYSTYNRNAQVSSLIIEEDQPEASHIAVVYSDAYRQLMGKAELPASVRELIKNYKMTTWNPSKYYYEKRINHTVIDLEKQIMKRQWYSVYNNEIPKSIHPNSSDICYDYFTESWSNAVAYQFVTDDGVQLHTSSRVNQTFTVDGVRWTLQMFEGYVIVYRADTMAGKQPSADVVEQIFNQTNLMSPVWAEEKIEAEPINFVLREPDELLETPEWIYCVESSICSGEPTESDDGDNVYWHASSSHGVDCSECGDTHPCYANRPVIKAFIKNDIIGTLKDHESRITAIEASLCLQEGTQILMADGTTKNIEDVKYGDTIMTWDIDNNCTIPCKSYGSIFTGYSTGWQYYCFDNGSVLKIQQNHRIYKAEKQIPMLSTKWHLGDQGIASNGELATFYYAPTQLPEAIERRKYSVFSETGLYFANDILCGHLLSQPLNVHQRTHGGIRLSKEERATLLEYATARDQEYLVELQYPEYMQEALPYRKKKEKSEMQIEKYKKKLADRDYKTIKASQGKLTEEEIAENIEICDELRVKIREKEGSIITCDEKIKELQAKYDIRIRPLAEIETENIKKAIANARDKYISLVEGSEAGVESEAVLN